MAVASTTRKQQFTLDAVTAAFTFTFPAIYANPTDIKCIVTLSGVDTTLTYTTNYTVTVNSNGIGGTVTLVSPATTGLGTLTVYRDSTNLQGSDYKDFNTFPSDTLEGDLDLRTMKSIEHDELLGRCVYLPITLSGVSSALPTPTANNVLGWNSAATALENKVVTGILTSGASRILFTDSSGNPTTSSVLVYDGITITQTDVLTTSHSMIQQNLLSNQPQWLYSNGLFQYITGDFWLGWHLHQDATSNKSTGIVHGIHGEGQSGRFIAIDGTTSWIDRAFVYGTGSNPLFEINLNRLFTSTDPSAGGTASGTSYTGKVWRLLLDNTENYYVDYQGNINTTGEVRSNGNRVNYVKTAYGTGTGYNLTNAQAAVSFSGTSPTITLDKAGTYKLSGRVHLFFSGLNLAYGTQVTHKLRRTNNTAADVTGATTTLYSGSLATLSLTETGYLFDLPEVVYTTTNTDDIISMFGGMSASATAGNLQVIEASIVAVRLY